MKYTKCLFNENQSPEGMVSVSQIQTFLSCKKKWEYNYIKDLKPKVERSYLTIGKLCHKGMQVAMQSKWEYPKRDWQWCRDMGLVAMEREFDEYRLNTPHLEEEIPDFEQLLHDSKLVFSQAFEEFEPWKYEVLSIRTRTGNKPALELHFKVPCPPTRGLHGYIDAILKDITTGFTWCVDYKFRKSFAPDEDESFNIQNAVYCYACRKMGIDITGTMTWQHLNTPAADPKLNKDGTVSVAKIKTTWNHYRKFLINNGKDPYLPMYAAMKEKLSGIEWCRSTLEYRNDETILNMWTECVAPAAKAIKSAHNKTARNFRSLYPWNCKMCQYKSLCQAELRDYDVESVILREYERRKR